MVTPMWVYETVHELAYKIEFMFFVSIVTTQKSVSNNLMKTVYKNKNECNIPENYLFEHPGEKSAGVIPGATPVE